MKINEEIESLYRSGAMTNAAIGEMYKVSGDAVRKMAKRKGWKKFTPMSEKKLAPEVCEFTIKKPLSESFDTKKNDTLAYMSIDLAERMLEELHQMTTYQGELKALILAETEEDRDAKRRAAMLKAISLPIRANTLKTISQILINTKGNVSFGVSSKKQQNTEKAKVAIKGKFAPSEPPKLSTVKQSPRK